MKIKAVEAICKAQKTIILMESGGRQWISNGSALFPLYNLPHLSQENIFTMFDIPEDKRDKYYFEQRDGLPSGLCFDDTVESEQPITRGMISIVLHGRILEPLQTSVGILYINQRYLAPFDDAKNGIELYERADANGRIYIVVKDGMLLCGVILPVFLQGEDLKVLKKLAELSDVTLMNMQPGEGGDDIGDQIAIDCDEL